jgi:predicted DCC family thiol-disulfide oxidoreductase YuxK
MNKLYVLYDATCGICDRARCWMGRQPALLALEFVSAGSPVARMLFPALASSSEELTVVSDEGEVWHGAAAWLMCLWALTEFREWSHRLSSPALAPFARQAFELLSKNRKRLSEWLQLMPEEAVADRLRGGGSPACAGAAPPRAFGVTA